MTDIPTMAAAERQAIHDDVADLTDEQWATMTVCAPWTVRTLICHLTALGNQTAPNFFKGMAKNRFDFNKFIAGDLVKYDQGSNADVLAGYAKTLPSTRTPPGPKYVALGEYTCHGEDILRALGESRQRPEEQIVTLAELYKSVGKPFDTKKRLKGLKLTATDVDWTTGDGPEITGPGLDLILGMTGRLGALDTCSGEGLDTFRSRYT